MAYSDEYKSAQEVLNASNKDGAQRTREAELVASAEAAGVTRSEYVGYSDAFEEYESRPDVEPLAERRAREAGTHAEDTNFRRAGTGSAAVFTSPGDGNVGGLTDSDGNAIDTPGDGSELPPESPEAPEVP